LNGFEVDLPAEIDVIVQSFPDASDVKDERDRLGSHWFVHWLDGELYCIRLKPGGPNILGHPRRLKTCDYPWLLRARLDDVIATVFDRYAALRRRPFSFLAQRDEIVESAAEEAHIRHPLLRGFRILPKFTLNAKIIEPRDGEVRLGLFVTVGMRYEVNADLVALQSAGVDLSGLHVVRRQVQPGERRLVGRIDRLADGVVHLTEATDKDVVAAPDVRLEGSLESFTRCLRTLLGGRYLALRDAVDDIEAKFRVGPAFDAVIERMGDFLRKKSPINLALGLEAKIGNRLRLQNEGDGTCIYTAPPVEYVYDRAGTKRAKYAWQGLQTNGPYDRSTFAKKSPRIIVVYPATSEGKVEVFLKALRDGIPPPQRAFPNGFGKAFGLVNPEFIRCPVRVGGIDRDRVAAAYRSVIEAHLSKDAAIDAGIVVLLDEHAHLPLLHNPYIRTKALLWEYPLKRCAWPP
jgi:hypothetical protein